MILHSTWRWPSPQPVSLDKLTPSVVHQEFRHRDKTTPSILEQSLWYPICCIRTSLDYWDKYFVKNQSAAQRKNLLPAVINSDNSVWIIKVGCNRYFSALELGYTAIDCVFFPDSNDAVRMARWYQQCDPVHNTACAPYSGKFDYD